MCESWPSGRGLNFHVRVWILNFGALKDFGLVHGLFGGVFLFCFVFSNLANHT